MKRLRLESLFPSFSLRLQPLFRTLIGQTTKAEPQLPDAPQVALVLLHNKAQRRSSRIQRRLGGAGEFFSLRSAPAPDASGC